MLYLLHFLTNTKQSQLWQIFKQSNIFYEIVLEIHLKCNLSLPKLIKTFPLNFYHFNLGFCDKPIIRFLVDKVINFVSANDTSLLKNIYSLRFVKNLQMISHNDHTRKQNNSFIIIDKNQSIRFKKLICTVLKKFFNETDWKSFEKISIG